MRTNGLILKRSTGFGLSSIFLFFLSMQVGLAQTPFWFEDFGTGCDIGTLVNTHTHAGSGLAWTLQAGPTHANAGSAWFVSGGVHFSGIGNCGDINCGINPAGTNKTLHISTDLLTPDNGPTYDFDSTADVMAITPAINCTGQQAIEVRFQYFEGGNADDHATLWYDNGSSVFTLLDSIDKTAVGPCGLNGQWNNYSVFLPASANNNNNIRLGFRWEANSDGVGQLPSFAVDSISLSAGAPIADFDDAAITICDGACLTFADMSQNQPNTYEWTFTGAATTTSTSPNPTNICYPTPGTYDVKLKVCNANNLCDSITRTNHVVVNSCPGPNADFNIINYTGQICTGTSLSFSDQSVAGGGAIDSWAWTFNGAVIGLGVDTLQNPVGVLYNTPGTWPVQLIVTDINGKMDTLDSNVVVIACQPPNPDFRVADLNDTIICQTECVDFTNLSTGTFDLSEWTFTGGTPSVSNLDNPTNICYSTPGFYEVKLKVINTLGQNSDSITKTAYIQVLNCPVPNANFSSTARTICPGDRVSFTDNTSGFPSSWQWTFFGADTNAADDQNPINIRYDSAGSYDVELIVCDDLYDPLNPSAHPCDTLLVEGYIKVDSCNIPEARVGLESDTICVGSCVRFLNSSRYIDTTDTNDSWEWVFYDKTDSIPSADSTRDSTIRLVLDTTTLFNPIRCFDSTGKYSVRLFVENVFGSDIILENDILVVGSYPTVTAGGNVQIRKALENDYDYRNNTTTITSIGTGEFFSWTPEIGLECPTCPESIVNPERSTKYFITNTNIFGCRAQDSLEVIVDQRYFAGIPNIFSPNNDDKNDILYLRGNGINNIRFFIQNRYGQKIFESFDQSIGWNGRHENTGEELEPGVYVYYIKLVFLDGTIEELKGNVTLIR